MRRRTCDTCEGYGEARSAIDDTEACPDCQGEGSYADPSILDRTLGGARADRIRAGARRRRRQLDRARQLWHDRDATTVAAYVYAHRNLIEDEPRLRATIQGDLMHRLAEQTTLRWRAQDARHALENARRAILGQPPEPRPWEDVVTVSMSDQSPALADFDTFARGQLVILAERRRVPAGDAVRARNLEAYRRETELSADIMRGRKGHRLLMGDELTHPGPRFWSPWRCTCGEASGTGADDGSARKQFDRHLVGLWPAFTYPSEAAPEAVEHDGDTIWVSTAQAEAYRAAQQAPQQP
jgi:hypothetical protein